MFKVATLISMAEDAQQRYDALLQKHPSGTFNEERNLARQESATLMACAEWMMDNNIDQMANVGPLIGTPVKKGQRVRVRKGAKVTGTFQGGKEGIILARSQVVTVHALDKGYLNFLEGRDRKSPKMVQSRVVWAGSGGYWRYAELNDVEVLKDGQD